MGVKRPWNIVDMPVYSLATYHKGQVNMNICTYVSAVSMKPKLFMVAIDYNTQTYQNLQENDTAVLQILHEDQQQLVPMLGKKSGVAKQILDIQPKAVVTHCHCHSLSLSVKETTKESKFLSNAMDTSAEIAVLIKYSPKREQKLELIKEVSFEEDELEKSITNRISKLSTTRWTVRANCFQRILENYSYLYDLWNECLQEQGLTRDVKSHIIGCKSQMESFDLYFGLKIGKLLYSHTDKLSQTLILF